MSAHQRKEKWFFRVHVLDRAGALTSIASAFSNEGINIDTVDGHGTEKTGVPEGAVILTFSCTEAEKEKMVRKIRRLSKVKKLEERPYNSHNLRKSAVVRVCRDLKPADVAGEESFITCEPMREVPPEWHEEEGCGQDKAYFLAGAPRDLDPILLALEKEGALRDIIISIIGL